MLGLTCDEQVGEEEQAAAAEADDTVGGGQRGEEEEAEGRLAGAQRRRSLSRSVHGLQHSGDMQQQVKHSRESLCFCPLVGGSEEFTLPSKPVAPSNADDLCPVIRLSANDLCLSLNSMFTLESNSGPTG